MARCRGLELGSKRPDVCFGVMGRRCIRARRRLEVSARRRVREEARGMSRMIVAIAYIFVDL
jgi:hypothetical protein